jgi:hypothetical protein
MKVSYYCHNMLDSLGFSLFPGSTPENCGEKELIVVLTLDMPISSRG